MLLRGVELAEKAGEQAEVSHSEGVLSVALGYVGDYEQARARADSCWTIAERLGDPVRMAGAHFYYAVLGESKFDWTMGVDYSARLLSFVEERRMSGLYLLMGTIFGGRHQFHVGRLGRARALLHNALNLSNVLGIGMGKGWAQAFLGDVYFVAGDHAAARRCYEDGLAIGNAGGKDEYAAGMSLMGLAHTEAHLSGDLEATRRWAGEGLTRLEQMSNITALAHALQRYGEALEHLGDEEGAAAIQARRAENNARISVEVRDWWPQVPEELVVGETDRSRASSIATSSGRELWEHLRQSTGAELPTVRMTSSAIETRDNLMESLASVDDFVPEFVAPQAG
jgi:tetratricopeptide (TPR) repeat protein